MTNTGPIAYERVMGFEEELRRANTIVVIKKVIFDENWVNKILLKYYRVLIYDSRSIYLLLIFLPIYPFFHPFHWTFFGRKNLQIGEEAKEQRE